MVSRSRSASSMIDPEFLDIESVLLLASIIVESLGGRVSGGRWYGTSSLVCLLSSLSEW